MVTSDEAKLIKRYTIQQKLFNYLKEHPIINIGNTAKALGLSYNGVATAVNKMIELGILNETSSKARDRIFEYSNYIKILKSGT